MEWILALLSAAAGVAVVWRNQHPSSPLRMSAPGPLPDSYVPVIFGGAFRFGRGNRDTLDRVCLTEQGLAVVGNDQTLEFAFAELRALAHQQLGDAIQLDIYLEREERWGVLTLVLKPADMPVLLKLIRRSRPDLTPLEASEAAVYSAQLADQTLHGDLSVGAEVSLYVLGRLLVVVQNETVLAKVTITGIRRVIATQMTNSKGLVRLYSATETTLFVAENYGALAYHLADQARCPLDFVTVNDRKTK